MTNGLLPDDAKRVRTAFNKIRNSRLPDGKATLASIIVRELEKALIPTQIALDPFGLASETNTKIDASGKKYVLITIGVLGLVSGNAQYSNGAPKTLDTLLAHESAHAYGAIFEGALMPERRAGSIESEYRYSQGMPQRDGNNAGVMYEQYPKAN